MQHVEWSDFWNQKKSLQYLHTGVVVNFERTDCQLQPVWKLTDKTEQNQSDLLLFY